MGYFESFIGVNFWTALFTLLNFLVLFFVARKYLIGPILQIIADRQKEIDDLYADAGNAKTNAECVFFTHTPTHADALVRAMKNEISAILTK